MKRRGLALFMAAVMTLTSANGLTLAASAQEAVIVEESSLELAEPEVVSEVLEEPVAMDVEEPEVFAEVIDEEIVIDFAEEVAVEENAEDAADNESAVQEDAEEIAAEPETEDAAEPEAAPEAADMAEPEAVFEIVDIAEVEVAEAPEMLMEGAEDATEPDGSMVSPYVLTVGKTTTVNIPANGGYIHFQYTIPAGASGEYEVSVPSGWGNNVSTEWGYVYGYGTGRIWQKENTTYNLQVVANNAEAGEYEFGLECTKTWDEMKEAAAEMQENTVSGTVSADSSDRYVYYKYVVPEGMEEGIQAEAESCSAYVYDSSLMLKNTYQDTAMSLTAGETVYVFVVPDQWASEYSVTIKNARLDSMKNATELSGNTEQVLSVAENVENVSILFHYASETKDVFFFEEVDNIMVYVNDIYNAQGKSVKDSVEFVSGAYLLEADTDYYFDTNIYPVYGTASPEIWKVLFKSPDKLEAGTTQVLPFSESETALFHYTSENAGAYFFEEVDNIYIQVEGIYNAQGEPVGDSLKLGNEAYLLEADTEYYFDTYIYPVYGTTPPEVWEICLKAVDELKADAEQELPFTDEDNILYHYTSEEKGMYFFDKVDGIYVQVNEIYNAQGQSVKNNVEIAYGGAYLLEKDTDYYFDTYVYPTDEETVPDVWKVYFTQADTLNADEEKEMAISDNGGIYFKFIPTMTAAYFFEEVDGIGTQIREVYDADGTVITGEVSVYGSNEYNLTAGTEYYLNIYFYSMSETMPDTGKVLLRRKLTLLENLAAAKPIKTDQEVSAQGTTYFKVTPEKDGSYYFIGTQNEYISVNYIYNENGEDITASIPCAGTRYTLEADTVYYFETFLMTECTVVLKKEATLMDHLAEADVLTVGVAKEVAASVNGGAYIKVVPEVTAVYSFEKVDGISTGMMNVYDAQGNSIIDSVYTDRGNEYSLSEGTEYYFYIGMYAEDGMPITTVGKVLLKKIPSFLEKLQASEALELGVEKEVAVGEQYYFKYTADASTAYYFKEYEETWVNIRDIYDQDGNSIWEDISLGSGRFELTAGATYYFDIYVDYDMDVESGIVLLKRNLSWEEITAGAAELRAGDTLTGVLEEGEISYFRFTPQATGGYLVSGTGCRVKGYDATGEVLDQHIDGYTEIYKLEAGKTYYFELDPRYLDEYEENEVIVRRYTTWEERVVAARTLELNKKATVMTDENRQVAIFTYTVPKGAGGRYQVTSAASWIYLYDEEGIVREYNTLTEDYGMLEAELKESSKYYFVVDRPGDGAVELSLLLKVCDPWADRTAGAKDLVLKQQTEVTVSSSDELVFFKYKVPSTGGGVYYLRRVCDSKEDGTVMKLYSADGKKLGSSSMQYLYCELTAGRTYYFTFTSPVAGKHLLRLVKDVEPGDAQEIKLNEKFAFSNKWYMDDVLYKFTIPSGAAGIYTLKAEGAFDGYIGLYDETFSSYSGDSYIDSFDIGEDMLLTENAVYYLKINQRQVPSDALLTLSQVRSKSNLDKTAAKLTLNAPLNVKASEKAVYLQYTTAADAGGQYQISGGGFYSDYYARIYDSAFSQIAAVDLETTQSIHLLGGKTYYFVFPEGYFEYGDSIDITLSYIQSWKQLSGSAEALKLNTEVSCTEQLEKNQKKMYKYTVPADGAGKYSLWLTSSTEESEYVSFFDADGRLISKGYFDYDSSSKAGRTYELEGGKTYYFGIEYRYSMEKTGFALKLEKLPNTDETMDQIGDAIGALPDASAGTLTEEQKEAVNQAAEKLNQMDNEEMLSTPAAANENMNLVAKVEELLVAANAYIEPTAVSADPEMAGTQVEGAALTVADWVKNNGDPDNSKYAAKVTVNKSEGDFSDLGSHTYALDINLSVINSETQETLDTLEPTTPLRITVPVPEMFRGKAELKLYHIMVNGHEVLDCTLNADGTMMTFITPSLSDFVIAVKDCGDGKHTLGAWTTVSEATCTTDGKKTAVCSVCEKTVEEVTKGAHKPGEWAVTVATCAVNGKKTQSCTVCQTVLAEEAIPATGQHAYGEWTETKKATALAEGEQTKTCTVCGDVQKQATAKLKATIKLNVSGTLPMKRGQSVTVKVSGLAEGDKVVSWKSSNKKIVTVSKKGKLTASKKKSGTAKITVKLASGLKKTFKVKVQKSAVKTTKITLNCKSKLTLTKGKSFKLKVTKAPITSKQKVKFSSSNKKIATVSSKGTIKAKKKGTVKITVKAGSKKKVITVKVQNPKKKK